MGFFDWLKSIQTNKGSTIGGNLGTGMYGLSSDQKKLLESTYGRSFPSTIKMTPEYHKTLFPNATGLTDNMIVNDPSKLLAEDGTILDIQKGEDGIQRITPIGPANAILGRGLNLANNLSGNFRFDAMPSLGQATEEPGFDVKVPGSGLLEQNMNLSPERTMELNVDRLNQEFRTQFPGKVAEGGTLGQDIFNAIGESKVGVALGQAFQGAKQFGGMLRSPEGANALAQIAIALAPEGTWQRGLAEASNRLNVSRDSARLMQDYEEGKINWGNYPSLTLDQQLSTVSALSSINKFGFENMSKWMPFVKQVNDAGMDAVRAYFGENPSAVGEVVKDPDIIDRVYQQAQMEFATQISQVYGFDMTPFVTSLGSYSSVVGGIGTEQNPLSSSLLGRELTPEQIAALGLPDDTVIELPGGRQMTLAEYNATR